MPSRNTRFSDITDQQVITPRSADCEPVIAGDSESETLDSEEANGNLSDSEKLRLSEENISPYQSLECEIKRKKQEEQKYIEQGIASLDRGSSFISSRNFLIEQGVDLKPQKPHDRRTFLVSTTVIESNPESKKKQSIQTFPQSNSPSKKHKHLQHKLIPRRSNQKLLHKKTSSDTMFNGIPSRYDYMSGDTNRMNSLNSYNYSGDGPVSGGPLIGYSSNYMSGGGDVSFASSNRLHEKEELQKLNDRFTAYVNKVRSLRDSRDSTAVDSAGFIQTAKILEDEIRDLKNLYENELEKYRQQLETVRRDKSSLEIQLGKSNQVSRDLQDRLSVEIEKNGNLSNDINEYQRRISQLEQERQGFEEMVMKPQEELEHLRREYESLIREIETFKRRYEHEQLARQEAENKAHQFAQKLELCEQVHTKEFTNLKDRLQAANDTILSMEAKMRGMNKEDINVGDILQKVREASELELKKYQMESEENYTKNINALTHENKTLASQLVDERQRATEQLHLLNKKVKDLQELLFQKMKELGAARDTNIPLKAEIESLKVILEEEEKRLRMTNGNNVAPSTTNAILPAISSPTRSYNIQPSYPPLRQPDTSYMSYNNINPNLEDPYAAEAEAAMPVVNIDPSLRRRTKYVYNTDASVNRLSMDSDSRPIGPITTHRSLQGGNTGYSQNVGGGTDYFENMFRDMVNEHIESASPRPESSTTHDFTTSTNSAVGDIKIIEVNQEGKYVRLENCGSKDVEFGGFMIQQNVGGHPVAVYRFPPRVTFSSKATLTVWAGSNDLQLHNPPTDFVWKEQLKWGTGPECTTILCRPNGQAIAWTTAAHRFTRNAFEESPTDITPTAIIDEEADIVGVAAEEESLTETNVNVNEPKPEGVFLKRGKVPPPSLNAPKHPHGTNTSNSAHPHTGQNRPLTLGNDNSTWSRQSRSQSCRPDPITGQPNAGAPGQRIGSAPLRKYTVKGSGAIANKSAGTIRYGQPTPFLSPLQQEYSQVYDSRSTSLVRFST